MNDYIRSTSWISVGFAGDGIDAVSIEDPDFHKIIFESMWLRFEDIYDEVYVEMNVELMTSRYFDQIITVDIVGVGFDIYVYIFLYICFFNCSIWFLNESTRMYFGVYKIRINITTKWPDVASITRGRHRCRSWRSLKMSIDIQRWVIEEQAQTTVYRWCSIGKPAEHIEGMADCQENVCRCCCHKIHSQILAG